MNKLNNKGFTLVEVIAVVVILAVLGMIAVPNILGTINKSKDATYDILVKDIVVASQQLYEEIEYNGSTIYIYDKNGNTNVQVYITPENKIPNITLQTLVSNGFLTGTNNPNPNGTNKNKKVIVNPKTKKDIWDCSIRIRKKIENQYEVKYIIEPEYIEEHNNYCPSRADYDKVLQ